MAAVVLLVCFMFVVFQAGYHWRKASTETNPHDREAVRLSMLSKL